MPTSYTTSLRLALPAAGELDGTWGTTMNQSITQLLEDAVAGFITIDLPYNQSTYTLSTANGAADESRNAFIKFDGNPNTNVTVTCPSVEKLYFIQNDVFTYNVTLKTASGTGVLIPAGHTSVVVCDGTNVNSALSYLPSLRLATALSTLYGGTGLTTPGTAGNVLTSTGSVWQSSTAPGARFLSSVVASNSATVDLETTFNSTYDVYCIVGSNVIVQTDGTALNCRVKHSGAYTATGYYYRTSVPDSGDLAAPLLVETGSATNSTGFQSLRGSNTSEIQMFPNISNSATLPANFTMYVYGPSSALQKSLVYSGACTNTSSDIVNMNGAGRNTTTNAVTGVRFLAGSGNIVSGTFRLYGVPNS